MLSKKLKKTVNIGTNTPIDMINDDNNQTFKVLNIFLVYNIDEFFDIPYKKFLCPKSILGKGKDPKETDFEHNRKKKNISIFKRSKDI